MSAEDQHLRDAMIVSGAPRSVMWGLESASFALLSRHMGIAPGFLGESQQARIGVNALFDGDAADLEHDLERLAPYPAVKVKVGRQSLDTDRTVLSRLVDALPDTRLRVDANRLLDVAQTVELLASVPAERIEYVEDPVADLDDLVRFHDETGFEKMRGGAVGMSELAMLPAPAAVGNAVFNATGWRPTEIPLSPHRVLANV